MPAANLRVALAQTTSHPGDLDANARAAASSIAAAADGGAHLVVFPELALTGYELAYLAATASGWLGVDDARLDPVRRACAAGGVTAVLGAAHCKADGERVIAAPVVDPQGHVAMSVKEHLHGGEEALFRPGLPLSPFDVHGWRVAVGICFDAAQPDHAARAARDGADLYVVSALYTRGEERRSDLHLGARAMDNRIFTSLANHAGTTGGHLSCGLSGAWGPSGARIGRAGVEAALVIVDLDREELARYRPVEADVGIDVALRAARLDDLRTIHALRRDAILGIESEALSGGDRRAWADQRNPEFFGPRVAAGEIVLARLGGAVVGWGSRSGSSITGIYVHPSSSRIGIGQALMTYLERAIADGGHGRATLESSPNAVAFYTKLGYVPVGAPRDDGALPMAKPIASRPAST